MSEPDLTAWITWVDCLRHEDRLFRRGVWHGYKEPQDGATPMRGEFCLVRRKRPTVAVSHDDPEACLQLARIIESNIADEWTM